MTRENSLFLQLPTEILVSISIQCGFRTCLVLRSTSKRLRRILSDPSCYTSMDKSPDVIETIVTVNTKLHVWDHLVFGQWELFKDAIYFEHMTFLESMDFLGGISFKMHRNGHVDKMYFEHRESLDCYVEFVLDQHKRGLLPPSIHGTGGVRLPHSCNRCKHYDTKSILSSYMVHHSQKFGIRHHFVDGKRILQIRIVHIKDDGHIPSVDIQVAKIDNIPLSSFESFMFSRLVWQSNQ
ncbi:hypothetical protein EDD86DRAFT_189081 [Gorgonomyces haynaldii]|nr:hypothetical protein EDD86DRAFT_189081 [Gorgonomyces haynaldii]